MSQKSKHIFHVQPQQARQTLAGALRKWLPEKSWGEIRRMLSSRRVMLNGNICTEESKRLSEKDVVKILTQSAGPAPSAERIRVVHLDAHLAVVEKPPGITSNRHADERGKPQHRRQLQPTLDELLPMVIARMEQSRFGKRQRGVPTPVRPVHRLDRDTGGLMVFARSVRAEQGLSDQFREHTVHRRYMAIAEGDVHAQTIETYLSDDRGDGRRGSVSDPEAGKHAVTHVRPLERLGGYTLVECRLETGRTHQIRIHLSEQGHPLCGEKIYRKPLGGKPLPDRSGAPRLALHAAELGFVHPVTGEELRFESRLPADLSRFLAHLRSERDKKKVDAGNTKAEAASSETPPGRLPTEAEE